MTMEYEQWKRILSAVNEEEGLSKDNVIERIEEKLKVKDKDEYKKWEKAGFSVNYLFQVTFYREKYTLLYLAVLQGHIEIVNALLEVEKINVNAADKNGYTPLHLATLQDRTEIVKVLLQAKGIDVNAADKNGYTPLHLATLQDRTEIVKILIENGADPLIKDEHGKTPRDLAQDDVIKKLLEEAEETQLGKTSI